MNANDLMHICIILGKKIPAMTFSKKTGKYNLPKKDFLLLIASSGWAEFKAKKYEKNKEIKMGKNKQQLQQITIKIKGVGDCRLRRRLH